MSFDMFSVYLSNFLEVFTCGGTLVMGPVLYLTLIVGSFF